VEDWTFDPFTFTERWLHGRARRTIRIAAAGGSLHPDEEENTGRRVI
jgi:hypothetical protein